MTFHELVWTWFPQAQEMFRVNQNVRAANTAQAIAGLFNGK